MEGDNQQRSWRARCYLRLEENSVSEAAVAMLTATARSGMGEHVRSARLRPRYRVMNTLESWTLKLELCKNAMSGKILFFPLFKYDSHILKSDVVGPQATHCRVGVKGGTEKWGWVQVLLFFPKTEEMRLSGLVKARVLDSPFAWTSQTPASSQTLNLPVKHTQHGCSAIEVSTRSWGLGGWSDSGGGLLTSGEINTYCAWKKGEQGGDC